MSRYVIFLGAGASASEGVPLQGDLLRSYFSEHPDRRVLREFAREVIDFFRLVFDIDVLNLEARMPLPTFEEVLGLIDLATSRAEGFRGIPLHAPDDGGLNLSSIRRRLILLMADAIHRRVPGDAAVHSRLVRNLRTGDRLAQTSFLTTNYDSLLDSALEDDAVPLEEDRGLGTVVEYGFSDLEPRSPIPGRETRSFPLYKIHGSLNWLYCSVCTDLAVTHGPDIVARLLDAPGRARCNRCQTMREPLIVPPTLYKSLSSAHLAIVWNHAARALRDCAQLVFCGYSLADADMHVKYLVKAAQMNRNPSADSLRITLVNNYPDKSDSTIQQEFERYARLFGSNAVSDAHLSFQDFAADPGAILGRARQ